MIIGPKMSAVANFIDAGELVDLKEFIDYSKLLKHTVTFVLVDGSRYTIPFSAHTNGANEVVPAVNPTLHIKPLEIEEAPRPARSITIQWAYECLVRSMR